MRILVTGLFDKSFTLSIQMSAERTISDLVGTIYSNMAFLLLTALYLKYFKKRMLNKTWLFNTFLKKMLKSKKILKCSLYVLLSN